MPGSEVALSVEAAPHLQTSGALALTWCTAELLNWPDGHLQNPVCLQNDHASDAEALQITGQCLHLWHQQGFAILSRRLHKLLVWPAVSSNLKLQLPCMVSGKTILVWDLKSPDSMYVGIQITAGWHTSFYIQDFRACLLLRKHRRLLLGKPGR